VREHLSGARHTGRETRINAFNEQSLGGKTCAKAQ
jgi:hypothetical protein